MDGPGLDVEELAKALAAAVAAAALAADVRPLPPGTAGPETTGDSGRPPETQYRQVRITY